MGRRAGAHGGHPWGARAGERGRSVASSGSRCRAVGSGQPRSPSARSRRWSGPTSPGAPMGWWQAAEVTAISGGSNMAGAWSITRSSRLAGHETDGAVTFDGRPDAWSWRTGGDRSEMTAGGAAPPGEPRLPRLADPARRATTTRPSRCRPARRWRLRRSPLASLGLCHRPLRLPRQRAAAAALPVARGAAGGLVLRLAGRAAGGCSSYADLDARLVVPGRGAPAGRADADLAAGRPGRHDGVGRCWAGSPRQPVLLRRCAWSASAAGRMGGAMLFVLVLFPYLMALAGRAAGRQRLAVSRCWAASARSGAVVRILRKPVVEVRAGDRRRGVRAAGAVPERLLGERRGHPPSLSDPTSR